MTQCQLCTPSTKSSKDNGRCPHMSAMPPSDAPPARETYRHGDLRRALLDAGMALAREGGPTAITLREATRRAGVAPNAAYRHFASQQALLQAVRAAALQAVAASMEDALAALPTDLSPADHARASVRAVGMGYLRYAQAEPGLFRTAFAKSDKLIQATPEVPTAGPGGRNPYELLCDAIDLLVQAGAMPAARRPGAEILAWSAVHGLAMLVVDGPLATPVGPHFAAFGQRLLDMVEKGL
jgi:AcrR family transcriptional regulator